MESDNQLTMKHHYSYPIRWSFRFFYFFNTEKTHWPVGGLKRLIALKELVIMGVAKKFWLEVSREMTGVTREGYYKNQF